MQHFIGNETIKKNLLNALPFWTGAAISGALAVLYAKLFAVAENWSIWLMDEVNPYVFLVVGPLCFVLAWKLVDRYSNYAKGSGIPQVVTAIELATPKNKHKIRELLSLKVIWVKISSSLLMVFGGGVIGREGPMIQISASVFKKINDILPEWYPKISKKNMLITGAAAGLASAFNTPLGGIVFAIEELTKTHLNYFKSALLTGVIIAGLTALYFLGPYLYLGYPELGDLSTIAKLSIFPLAVITSILGSYTGKLILSVIKKQRGMVGQYRKLMYVFGCGLVIAACAIFLGPDNVGSGKELMHKVLFTQDKAVQWYTPIVRIIGSVISFTAGAAGGIFAPALSSGGSVGALFADLLDLSGTDTNLLVLCGMVGFLTSISSTPFTSSIIVLEMTNSHDVIFYIMLSALVSYIVSKLITRHSLYDELKDIYLAEIRSKKVT